MVATSKKSRSISQAVKSDGKLRNVALLIGVSGSFGRGMLNGVAKFNREHGRWSTYFHPQGAITALPPWFKNWRGDGALVMIYSEAITRVLRRMKIPIINLRLPDHETGFPYVGLNHDRIAQLAAEHLLSLGLQHFAFCGRKPGLNPGLDERSAAFQKYIGAAGKTFTLYPGSDEQGWDQEQNDLAQWVTSLPKPIGIMASNDERGLHLLDACRRCGASVPDEVAVVGVDNDEQLCELAIPPLTSVDVNGEQVGYEAARQLEAMMSGAAQPPLLTTIDPRGIVTRRSTDVVASEDAEVNRAVAFIRANAGAGQRINVSHVLAHLGMSRASLQARMKQVLGRTIHDEIERVRLSRVKDLLLNSDMSIKQVTSATGFSSVQYMTRVFHRSAGETPAKFRKRRAV